MAYSLNSGVALYFANSSSQSALVNGGRTPAIGFHSVILKPDSVRRVTPPTTITAKTRAEDANNHIATGGGVKVGSSSALVEWEDDSRLLAKSAARDADALEEKKRGSKEVCRAANTPVTDLV